MNAMKYEDFVRTAFNAVDRGGDPASLADADFFRGLEGSNDPYNLLLVRTAVCYAMKVYENKLEFANSSDFSERFDYFENLFTKACSASTAEEIISVIDEHTKALERYKNS